MAAVYEGEEYAQLTRGLIPGAVAATIPNAAALSGAIALNGRLSGILFPAAWTAGTLTFMGSVDGGQTFADIMDITSSGATPTTRSLTDTQVQATLNKILSLSLIDWIGLTHVQLKSSVNQGAARNFVLLQAAG